MNTIYPLLKNRINKGLILKSALIFWILISGYSLLPAQNQIAIQVLIPPPYSPHLTSYIDNPNKVLISITNTGRSEIEIYLHGRFAAQDGSLNIETFSGSRPGRGLSLGPFESMQTSIIDLEDYFSLNEVTFTGITKEDLLNDQNVPEGDYQICLQAFDFNTSQPVSQYSCTDFSIQFTDPPIIISPVCGDSISKTDPQNIIISWTFPIGAVPGNIEYNLKMVEMYSADRDPNDALETATPPLFLDAKTDINSYLIGPSDPEFITGRYYAFLIQARDMNDDILFKNEGKSEVCWFKYYKGSFINIDIALDSIPDIKKDDFKKAFDKVIPNTSINGQLLSKPASMSNVSSGASGSSSSGNQGSSGGINYNGFFNNTGNANNNNRSFNFHTINLGKNINLTPPFGTGTLNASVYETGGAEPLRNTNIQLVARFNLKAGDGFFNTQSLQDGYYGGTGIDINSYKFYDLHGNEISYDKVLNTVGRVLDVTTTDNSGHFSFNFMTDFLTGPIYAVDAGGGASSFGKGDYRGVISLRVEVINQKFCSTDVDIFAKPGDALNIPPQLALIKDFDLQLTVTSAYDYYSGDEKDNTIRSGKDTKDKVKAGGQPIAKAIVKVLRDVQQLKNEHPSILLSEGQQLGSTTTNENGEFKDVFIGKTDSNGKITIPNLVEHWEPVDGKNHSPYFFSVRTRAEHADSTYDETKLNYESFFGDMTGLRISVDAGGTALLDDDAGWTGKAPIMYNHYYHPPTSANNREVHLMAYPPEIKGRLMVAGNLENIGLSDVEVNLFDQDIFERDGWTILFSGDNACLKDVGKYHYEYKKYTNESGFFRFQALKVNLENKATKGPYRRIQIEHPIYKRITWPPLNELPLNLEYGRLYFKEFQLEPKILLRGKVIDETGAAVKAYVKLLDNNPYIKTSSVWAYDNNGSIFVEAENFETAVAEHGNLFEILPLSNQYFPDTIAVNQLPQNPVTRISFVVHKKLHRLRLHVMNKETNAAITNASVVVGDTLAFGTTDNNGNVELNFPSPGEQFLIKVSGSSFTPTQISYNIPVSSTPTYKTLSLEPSLSISGLITEKTSSQPIDSALVFIRLQSTDGHTVYLETYSGSDGKYKLDNIPIMLTSVDIHVVKKGKNPSYIGTSKTVNIQAFAFPAPSYDFQLKAINMDLSEIWGFPVVVESFVAKQGKGVSISGYFYNLPNVPNFKTLNENERIYFRNLYINPENNKILPLSNSITTESYSVPLKIKGGFEGKLYIPSSWLYPQHLELKKNGDFAYIRGALYIDLASFKFAYDFHGSFFLGSDTTRNDLIAFRSTAPGGLNFFNSKLYVFNLNNGYSPIPINNFKVFGFNASSGFSQSYYQNEAIHIGTVLHTDIPMSSGLSLDLKIKAGEIEITRDDIDIKPNNDPLSFELEQWRVESNSSWYFDKTKDAIVIPRGIILTGLGVDASIKGLNIRPTALREGEIDLQGGLSLGGIVKLKLDKNLKPKFNFDAGVNHYRISLVGDSQGSVAWVDNLPATNDRLQFSSIGMLSDNSTVLSLGTHMLFHNILDIFVDQIDTGNGFFTLSGMPELGIPGFIPSMAGVTYTKDGGKLKAKLDPIGGGIDCNANVMYKPGQETNSQNLSHNEYTAYGDFYIKPPPGQAGEKLIVKGFLTKTPNSCKIDVIPQTILMGKEKMEVFEGNISVVNGAWGNLTFNSHTNSKGLDDKNIVSFEVLGGIKADAHELQVNNIETPLGDLNMSYIFSEKALVGDLTIKAKLNLGFASVNSGQMGMRFDPAGFYMGITGNVTITGQDYLGGFILGNYDSDLNSFTKKMLEGFETKKPDFSSLSGFYLIGQKNLLNESFSLVAIDVAVKAGLGAFIHLDFNDEVFEVGGYGFLKAKGGVDITGCGFIGVNNRAYMDVIGEYKNNNLTISTCSVMETCVGACGLEGCISIFSEMKISTGNPPDLTLKLDGECGN